MLSFILFVVVVILVIAMARMSRTSRTTLDYRSKSYQQGYWDGVRAAEQGVSSTKQGSTPEEGATSAPVPASSQMVASQHHHRDSHTTVNVALYVASLLLVGGVSLYVRLFTPGSGAAFVWVLIMAAAYYIFGLMLYKSVPILKPVAIAFVGTALAIMPYAGYLLHRAFIPDASICWCVVSVVCLAAYFHAAIRLHSEVISYAIIVIIVSTASSFASVLGAGILWFVVAMMLVGAAITFIAAANPRWLPQVFKRPFIVTQHILVPLAVVWALLLVGQFGAMEYTIVFAVATLYYGAAALQSQMGTRRRTWLWAAARATLTIAAACLAYEITDSILVVSAVLAATGVVQTIVSALHAPTGVRVVNQHEAWLWGGLGLIVLATTMADVYTTAWAAELAIELVAVTAIAIAVAWYLRRSAFLAFAIFGLMLLPMTVVHYLWHPYLADWVMVVAYGVLALGMPLLRKRYVQVASRLNMSLVYVAQGIFSLMTVIAGGMADTAHHHWWPAIAWIVIVLAAYVSAWIERRRSVLIVANSLAVVMLGVVAYALRLTTVDGIFFVAAAGFVGFYAAYLWLRYRAQNQQLSTVMWVSAMAVGLALSLVGIFMSDDPVSYGFALILIMAGAAMVYRDYETRRLRFADIAFIAASIGLQRMLYLVAPDTSMLVYSHWWVIVAFVLAYLHRKYGQGKRHAAARTLYSVVGLSILTLYGLGYAVEHHSHQWPNVLFLVEHVALVVYGLVRANKLFTIWGAVGVTIAILVMLPGFAFILLPVLGLGIIVTVIYVVARNSKQPPTS